MTNRIAIVTVTKNALHKGIALASFIDADVYCTHRYDIDADIVDSLRSRFIGGLNSRGNEFSLIDKSLQDFTGELFSNYESLIFITAAGIVVRCIAPYIRSKVQDPAVVVMDEEFNFAISLLSGHLGGANDLVNRLYHITGVTKVVTTATDIHGVIAFDNVAKMNNCVIENIDKLKLISSSLLHGEEVYLYCPYKMDDLPDNIILDDFEMITQRKNAVVISNTHFEENNNVLKLRPRNLYLGMGFKKGVKREEMASFFRDFVNSNHLSPLSFAGIATINLKENDIEIKEFANFIGLPVKFYVSNELKPYEEMFSRSEFVKKVTGVPSVCEPCAYLASDLGRKVIAKTVYPGVTFSVFEKNIEKMVL